MNANMNSNAMPEYACDGSPSESELVVNNKRVRFARGETSADYDGMIEVSTVDAYTVKARARQTMTIVFDGIASADTVSTGQRNS